MTLLVSSKRRPALRAAFFIALSLAGVAAARPLRAAEGEDLGALSRRVKELMVAGRFAEAIPLCERLVKAVPGNPGLILNLGMAEQMAGHPQRAIPRFEEVLKTDPKSVPALTSLARAELQIGEPKAAISPLKRLLALQPANREARGMLAGALLSGGELNGAVGEYQRLTEESPEDAKAWYGLGKAYQAQSAHLFDRLSANGPQSGYVAALIGASRLQSQQYHSSFFFFKEAAQTAPSLRGVHAGLAAIYRRAGHADWARIEEKKEEGFPAPDCAVNAPECYFMQNRYADAVKAVTAHASDAELYWGIKSFDQLSLAAFAHLKALPESVELHALQAQVAHSRNQELEAVSEWRAALKLSPGNPRLEDELTTSVFLARDYKTAMPMLEKAMKTEGASPDLNFMMGESLLRIEEPEKALPYLEKALRAEPNMTPAHASMGLALAKLSRAKEAIPHLEKALQLDDDGALHYQLARAYQQSGNAARASELMAQYQEIQKRYQQDKEEVTTDVQITPPSVN